MSHKKNRGFFLKPRHPLTILTLVAIPTTALTWASTLTEVGAKLGIAQSASILAAILLVIFQFVHIVFDVVDPEIKNEREFTNRVVNFTLMALITAITIFQALEKIA